LPVGLAGLAWVLQHGISGNPLFFVVASFDTLLIQCAP